MADQTEVHEAKPKQPGGLVDAMNIIMFGSEEAEAMRQRRIRLAERQGQPILGVQTIQGPAGASWEEDDMNDNETKDEDKAGIRWATRIVGCGFAAGVTAVLWLPVVKLYQWAL